MSEKAFPILFIALLATMIFVAAWSLAALDDEQTEGDFEGDFEDDLERWRDDHDAA